MKYKTWTKEEDDYLKQNYKNMTDEEMGIELGRSDGAVRGRRLSLRLIKHPRFQWNEEKIAFLTKNYVEKDIHYLSKKLNAPMSTIYNKASSLGLEKAKTGRYNNAEDDRLIKLRDKELTWEEIADRLDRTPSSVKFRHRKITGQDEVASKTLNYDKIEEYKDSKASGQKWADIEESKDMYEQYKELGLAIIECSANDLMESIKILKQMSDREMKKESLKPFIESVLKDESAFFTPIYNLCTKIPGEVMVRKCWKEVGVDRNKYLRKNLHLIS